MVVVVDKGKRTARLSLRASTILKALNDFGHELEKRSAAMTASAAAPEATQVASNGSAAVLPAVQVHASPEYGSFMVEMTPGNPYGGTTADLRLVEINMRLRRRLAESLLQANERLAYIPAFPMMGVGEFTEPVHPPGGKVSHSRFLPDAIINEHPRFATLTANIRKRRGAKVDIRVPLFQDVNTAAAMEEEAKMVDELRAAHERAMAAAAARGPQAVEEERWNAIPASYDPRREIYMDAMGFGMGCCCLQVTFQARNLTEARHLYDQLAVLAPIMLALTAGSPFFAGKIANTDVRWNVISQSVDDRTPGERGVGPPSSLDRNGVLGKSRYDSISCFISESARMKPELHNDLPLVCDPPALAALTAAGVDERLARHVAHLFTRDPLVIYREKVEQDDEKSNAHFENVQSTNWQSVRFKPPPPDSPIGWRVEFRTMELQMTDFENAAFTVFVALLSRALLFFDLNLYMPITKVDANMRTAHRFDAVRRELFYFRRVIQSCASDPPSEEVVQLSMAEIINGSERGFQGFIPIVHSYLDIIQCDRESRKVVNTYLDIIGRRAKGELLTPAQFLRAFVANHPAYRKDSRISHDICADIVELIDAINKGTVVAKQLLADVRPNVLEVQPPAASQRSAAAAAAADGEDEVPADERPVKLRSSSFHLLDLGVADPCEAIKRLLQKHLRP
jgi:glutamate--cysteine ligase catalytic subunit